MKKIAQKICDCKNIILIITIILFILSLIGNKLTNINYDILVYLPDEIETVQGQNILTEDFGMGAYTVVITENLSSKEILELEEKYKNIEGINQVISAYDIVGNTIPLDILPSDITSKIHNDNNDLIFVTFDESTSSLSTINAIEEMKVLSNSYISGMSSMVLDTMNLSNKEIAIYIIIAVILCLLVLELSLNSYFVPILLLGSIGIAIIFNLGSNIIFGSISYITKALVAVLQLGVTTDFSIFLYHAYDDKKRKGMDSKRAMSEAIVETFQSVTGSSLTTIAGFLVLCTMSLTLGKDLGLVMAKGVLIGVICVLTVFPSLILTFDKQIIKYKHKPITINFTNINKFIIKHHVIFFCIFLILLIPCYLANNNVSVYYKIDKSLPGTLDSIVANTKLKDEFNIVSPEIILVDKDMKVNDIDNMVKEIKNTEGINLVLSYSELKKQGLTEDMLPTNMVSIFESDKYQMIFINSIYEVASDDLNNQITIINNIVKKYDENSIVAGEGPLMKDLVLTSDEDFNNVNFSSIICILIIMIFVLKSLSLPILLILVIEFAIFVNFSFSYFSGTVLPFVAPIVLGTIQLGATIDYAILMTSTYIKNREDGKNREDAMLDTMNYCCNSIFVSGMCFFAATFGVGCYSKLEMVGSLCTLISRGAIISMVVVITILPSILLIFDNLIFKTTKTKIRKDKTMKKKNIILTSLILSLVIPINAVALTKEETVYAKLNSDGSVKKITVNEHLNNTDKLDTIEDISDLENIININGNEEYIKNDYNLTWRSNGNSIFYQGTSTKDLPISTSVTYKLDNNEISLSDLLGKSGNITIEIKYTNNEKHTIHGNTLYTPFVIMTAMKLDSNTSDIKISNGKVIDNGISTFLVGVSSPGLYESLGYTSLKEIDTITINYSTTNFSLPNIYMLSTSKILDNSDLEIFDKLDSIYSSINTLQSSMDKIEKGTNTILENMNTIESGSKAISTNLDTVLSNIEKLKSGSISVSNGLNNILSSLESAKDSISNTSSLNDIKTLISTNKSTIEKLKSANTSIKNAYINYNLESIDYSSITDNNLYTIKYNYENNYSTNEQMIYLLTKNNEALNTLVNTTNDSLTSINSMINILKESLTKVSEGSNSISNGLESLYSGVSTLSSKMNELSKGTSSILEGINTLDSGISKLNSEGIKKISKYSNNIKDTSTTIEDLIDLSNDYTTYTKSNNTNNTKFIMVIDSEEKKEEVKVDTTSEERLSFFQRLINLFK